MKIQSINNQAFTAGSQKSKEIGSFRRENIDAAISLSDKDLADFAYYQACKQTDDQKHWRINNALLLSLPVVTAVSETLLSRGNAVPLLNGKIVSSPAARAIKGTKAFAECAGILALGYGLAVGFGKLAEKSAKVRQFINNQPYTASVTGLVMGYALLSVAQKVVPAVTQKLVLGNKPMKVWHKIAVGVNKFNENKVVKNIAKTYVKASDKMHPALKAAGILGLKAAPAIVAAGSILHILNHRSVVNRQANENFTQLKSAQAALAALRLKELAQIDA